MQAHEIQTTSLRLLAGVRILRSRIVSISNEPDDEHGRRRASSSFLVTAIMTRDEFEQFKQAANQEGLWVNYKFGQFGRSADKYEYEMSVVPMR